MKHRFRTSIAVKRRFRSILEALSHKNDAFAEFTGRMLSLSAWLTLSVIGIAVWLFVHDASHGRFDPHLDTLIIVLTITTALDAAAAKVFQLALRRSDEKRDAQMLLTIEGIANIAMKITEELDRSRARDEAQVQRDSATAERDAVMRELVTRLLDHVEERRLEGVRRNG